MQKLLFFFLLCLGITTSALAQEDLGTHFLRGSWQAMNTNPALLPKERFIIKLPELYNNIYISSVTFNDLLATDNSGKTYLDIDQAIDQLDPNNQIREYLQVGTLGFGIQFGALHLNLQHSLRYNAFLDYPKTLPQLIWQGNAQFIGQEVDASTDVQVFGYHEIALGAGLRINKNLSLGGRIKWLGGIADVSTQRSRLGLRTDDAAYALSLNSDLLVNSSGAVTYNGFEDLSVDLNFGRFELGRAFNNNRGLAFDLGVQLQLGKLDLAASVLDIGQIDWKDDPRNYQLQGVFEFEGLDVAQGLLADSTEFTSVLDTLEEIFAVSETFNTYSTRLPRQLYLSAGYQLTDSWRLGLLYYLQDYRGQPASAVAVSALTQVLPFLQLGASYAWRSETFDNIGLQAMLRLGPLQVLASTDNLLTAWRLRKSNSANLRIGANLMF